MADTDTIPMRRVAGAGACIVGHLGGPLVNEGDIYEFPADEAAQKDPLEWVRVTKTEARAAAKAAEAEPAASTAVKE